MDSTLSAPLIDVVARRNAVDRRWKLFALLASAAAVALGFELLLERRLHRDALLVNAESECGGGGSTEKKYVIPPPLSPPTRHVPPSPPKEIIPSTDAVKEVAIVVLTRHGERPVDKDFRHLTPEGVVRAKYMAKCIPRAPSVAFPFGPPTRLLASLRGDSDRPMESLEPVAKALGMDVSDIENADMFDVYAVNKLLPTLIAGQTLLVSWQHWFLPRIIQALDVPTPFLLKGFPGACNTTEWYEPDYTRQTNGGDCYDIVWQVVFEREKGSNKPWQAVTYSHMHMGFGGEADSPCSEGFSPIQYA